jgi:hypothetical protein
MTEIATPIVSLDPPEGGPSFEFRIQIGSNTYQTVETGKVSYDDNGASDLTCEIDDVGGWLEERSLYKMADVHVRNDTFRGPGEWHHVFTGQVRFVNANENGLTEVEAFGIRNLLARKSFVNAKTYANIQLSAFLRDIAKQWKIRGGRMDVQGGARYKILKQQFQGEAKFLEAVDRINESARYIATDRPGFRLLVAPQPRPGIGRTRLGQTVRIGIKDYPPGGLDTPYRKDGPYSRVIAFQRDDTGKEVFRVVSFVRGIGREAESNEIFWIPDFPGDKDAARRQSELMARILSTGVHEPQLTGLPFREPIFTFDSARIAQQRRTREGIKHIIHEATVTSSTLDLTTGLYDVQAESVKHPPSHVRPRRDFRSRNPYLVETEPSML